MWVPLYIGTWFAVNQPSSSKIGRSPKPTDCVLVSVQTESFFTKVRVWIVYQTQRLVGTIQQRIFFLGLLHLKFEIKNEVPQREQAREHVLTRGKNVGSMFIVNFIQPHPHSVSRHIIHNNWIHIMYG